MRKCTIEGCNRVHQARGLCKQHYERARLRNFKESKYRSLFLDKKERKILKVFPMNEFHIEKLKNIANSIETSQSGAIRYLITKYNIDNDAFC